MEVLAVLKKGLAIILVFALCSGFITPVYATDTKKDEEFNIGEASGYLISNTETNAQIRSQLKWLNPSGGHGFAAERGNTLADKRPGIQSIVVGDNNVKNGADRVIRYKNGAVTWIQDKYYSTAKGSIEACFENGKFRYYSGDGKPMQIEVPKEQYNDAVKIMEDKIRSGQVEGVTNPSEAKNIVRKGHLSYKQAVNLTKAGNIDSLVYDAKTGVVTSMHAAGITFVIDFACRSLSGEDFDEALEDSLLSGLKTGSAVFVSNVISKQISRTQIGQKLGNFVNPTVLIVVLNSENIVDLFRGRISTEELLSNFLVSAGGLAGYTIGKLAGGAVGGLILPGGGVVVGEFVGGMIMAAGGSYLISEGIKLIRKSDAEEMYDILVEQFTKNCEDYLISEVEAEAITKRLENKLEGDTLKEMFASDDREVFAQDILAPLFDEQISKREKINVPSVTELREKYLKETNGKLLIH